MLYDVFVCVCAAAGVGCGDEQEKEEAWHYSIVSGRMIRPQLSYTVTSTSEI
jgi:hypothetical protein